MLPAKFLLNGLVFGLAEDLYSDSQSCYAPSQDLYSDLQSCLRAAGFRGSKHFILKSKKLPETSNFQNGLFVF